MFNLLDAVGLRHRLAGRTGCAKEELLDGRAILPTFGY